MAKEVWRNIVDEPNYRVSNKGNVKNKNTGRILKPGINRYGYPYVSLYNDGVPKPKTVHRLVARAFIPGYDNTLQVNHKDGNKTNNSVDNLEWMTRLENMRHAYDNGLISHRSGKSGRPAIPIRIVETGEVYTSETECAKAIGGLRENIRHCINGTRKTHRGYHFEKAI